MKKSFFSFILLLSLVSIILSACGDNKESSNHNDTVAPEKEQESFVVIDGVGNEVEIPGKIEKVYAPGLEDYLVTLGVTPVAQWSTGVSAQVYLQDALSGVKEISFGNGVPGPESVIDLEPDLILFPTSFYAQNGVYENYSKIAPTYVFENALGDAVGSLQTIAKLLSLEDKAEEAIKKYNEKLENAKSTLANITEGKKAVMINSNAKAIFLVSNQVYGGYILDQLGFTQSSLVKGQTSADLSLEALPDLDADYIFINDNDGLGKAFLKEIEASPLWEQVPAVKEGHVYYVKGDHWRSSGLIAYEKIIDDILEFLK